MTYRIIFQLVLFLLPFLAYGVWRLARQEAIEEGRKPWPITILFAVGAALAVLAWIVLIFVDRGGRDTCIQRAYTDPETGQIVKAREVPCEKHREDLGLPANSDPGSRARGLGGSDPAGPNTAPGPRDPEARINDEDPAEDGPENEITEPQ